MRLLRMKFSIALLALLPLHAHADGQPPPQDSVTFDASGQRIVLQTREWSDFGGGHMAVQQKLRVGEDGNLHYTFEDQSSATQAYHRALCDVDGLEPAIGGTAIFVGEGTGWHCNSVIEHGQDEELPDGERSTDLPPRSVDFVVANAPTGSALAGTNFLSTGNVRFQSSQAGSMQGGVQVDGRCSTYFSKYFANPFTGSHIAQVSCIVHQPRFVTTGMEGCVPQQCGNATGTISVR